MPQIEPQPSGESGQHRRRASPRATALAAPVFFDRLLDQIDPHQAPLDEPAHTARLLCGRWLALQCLYLQWTVEDLARATDLPDEALRLLELGLADEAALSEAGRRRLSETLTVTSQEARWFGGVVAIAQRLPGALDPETMDLVIADLEQFDSLPVEVQEGAMDGHGDDRAALLQNPAVFEILRALMQRNQHTYGVWQEVNAQMRVSVATVSMLLVRMLPYGLIEAGERRHDLELDSEPLQYYQIADAGRQAFSELRTKRAAAQSENPSALGPNMRPAL